MTAVASQYRPYPAYKPSGVDWLGDVPEHWEVKKLKFCLKPTSGAIRTGPFGSALRADDMSGSDVKVYNQRNIIDCDFWVGENFVSTEKFESLRSFELFPNDLVFTTRGTIGRFAIVPPDIQRGLLHPCLMRIQLDQNTIANRFALALLHESDLLKIQLESESDATTIEVIYSNTMKQLLLPIPPASEQDQIADFLDRETGRIDALVEKKQRLIELLEEKRTALISHAVTKGLNPNVPMKPSGVEWLGDVPEHWEKTRADGICRYHKRQIRSDSLDDREVFHYSIPVVQELGTGAVEDGSTIDSDKLHVDRELLLVSKLNPRKATITLAQPSPDYLCVCSTEFVPLDVYKGDSRFIYYIYASENVRQSLSSAVESATKSHQRVNPSAIAKLPLSLPPLPEQRAIADFLDRETGRIDALIDKNHEIIEKLRERRTALISAAVTGKIDVREEVGGT